MPNTHAPTLGQSLREYGRGLVGGLLFSLPLLYTNEVWQAGMTASSEQMLAGLAATFALLLLYNRYAGLHADTCWEEVAADSVEELGLGIVLSAAILWLTGTIGAGTTPDEALGMIVVEAMAVAIGVSVGTAQLGGGGDDEQGMDDEDDEPSGFFAQLALGFCGAFLVATTVAPTEEIVTIASEAPFVQLVLLAVLSLGTGGLVLFFSDFSGSSRLAPPTSRADALVGTVLNYAVGLVASAFLLWFFGRFTGATLVHAGALLAVLGFPAAIGASAGRLLLQTNR